MIFDGGDYYPGDIVSPMNPTPMSTNDKLLLAAAVAGFAFFVWMSRPDTAEEKQFHARARRNPRRRRRSLNRG